ncbi:hypothetical protein SBOR_6510 [Sclerotinia borealis F-4128]|uniref:Rhodanese domain-containing protein n=1 Tax=Sclerotinia borealis (strain F-4128) TaxID=1432307 RepID=W9CE77_SCLBF|nr:hypothetical protein SBOR_6510 [Sclerotinia borealis F-4128]
MTDTKNTKSEAQWWKAFPEAKSKCPEVTADDVMKLIDDMDITSEPRSFLLVDVRRDDWVGGTIKTSLNLPAQSFYQSRSSSGRGPRCAGWMQDYIDDVAKFGKKSNIDVSVLKGGIKGWVKEFEGMFMDGFEEGKWEELK